MKAYLIDPFAKEVSEVEHDGDFKQIYKFIDAEAFDCAHLANTDVIFVDDMGLTKDEQAFFAFVGYTQILAGKGLVLGTNEEGDTVEPKFSLDDVRSRVHWAGPPKVQVLGITLVD